eukprot:m.215778 g.215778  ORF g.215778 m.215778 type:complete len:143 (+) comp39839_c2_seq2:190-618(+)
MNDLYGILGVSAEAHRQTIRKAYQKRAFQCHPDKLPIDANEKAKVESRRVFQKVEEAWRVLGDPESRRKYDSEQAAARSKAQEFVNEVVDLSNMEYSDVDSCYFWPCRCGDIYAVAREELDDGTAVVPCCGCSLNIKVTATR